MKATKKAPRVRAQTPKPVDAQSAATNPQPAAANPRTRILLAAAGLCALTLLAYSNSFHAGFALDNSFLLKDQRIQAATAANLDLILHHTYWWPYGESGLYRPFTTLSYLFNWAVLGNRDQPAGYHWINLLLHAGNALLAFALARRLLRQVWPAVFVAAVWAVHPVLTESVTNIVGRADLLAAMATLAGVLLYLKSTEAAGVKRVGWLAGLLAVTTAGVFSKESAVAVLGVIALYEVTWWGQRRQIRGFLLGCAAMLPPILLMLYQRSAVLAASRPADFPFVDNPITGASFLTGRFTAIAVMARYLKLLAWPVTLSSDYSYSQIPLATGSPQDWLAWAAIAAAAVGVALAYRRNRPVFFLACFAFLTFLPASNLIFPTGTIMAERLLYLPSLGLVACLVIGVWAIGQRTGVHAAAPAVLCLIAAALAARTWVRNPDWLNNITLQTAAVQASPNSFKPHVLLAHSLYDADAGADHIDQEVREADRSVEILAPLPDPLSEPGAYRQAGAFHIAKGDLLRVRKPGGDLLVPPASVSEYQKGLQLMLRCISILHAERQRAFGRPEDDLDETASEAYQVLSTAYLRLGQPLQSYQAAAHARDLDPTKPEIYRQISYALLSADRGEDAAAELMEGQMLTGDLSLRDELLAIYRNGLDTKGCAVANGPNGPTLNPACETVHAPMCKAVAGSIRMRLRTGRRDLAESLKRGALGQFGCAAGPLNEVLPD